VKNERDLALFQSPAQDLGISVSEAKFEHRDVLPRGPSKGLCATDVREHFSRANRHSL
jgi:hypothetical protein